MCFQKQTKSNQFQYVLFIYSQQLIMNQSISKQLQKSRNDPPTDPREFLNRQTVIISSSDSEAEVELTPQIQQQPSALMPIQRKRETQEQKRQKINQIRQQWQKQSELQRINQQNIRNNPVARRQIQYNRAQIADLHKIFPSFKHLPPHSLAFVKNKLEEFDKSPNCEFKDPCGEGELKNRQSQRKELTRSILLGIEELKQLKDKTIFENRLEDSGFDVLKYSYIFYKKLYKKQANKTGEKYRQQIKIIINQFADKNNIDFRRRVIGRAEDFSRLAKVSQEHLKCQKTRQQQAEKLKLIIRESQKVEVKSPISIEEENEVLPLNMKMMNSFKSKSELIQENMESVQEIRRQNISKNKIIYKKAHISILQSLREMRERTQKLRCTSLYSFLPSPLSYSFDCQF